jgi:hypothetical protein
MRQMTIPACCLGILLAGAPFVAAAQTTTTTTTTVAATPAETAALVRARWTKARLDYLAAVKPFQANAANATLVGQFTTALDKTGVTLEKYLGLKLATPATPAAQLTPVVDQLIKDLTALRAVRSKATGALATALGAALTQHNEIAQTALKNMR